MVLSIYQQELQFLIILGLNCRKIDFLVLMLLVYGRNIDLIRSRLELFDNMDFIILHQALREPLQQLLLVLMLLESLHPRHGLMPPPQELPFMLSELLLVNLTPVRFPQDV